MKLATKTGRHEGYNYYKKIFLVSLCLCGNNYHRLRVRFASWLTVLFSFHRRLNFRFIYTIVDVVK